MRAYPKDIKQKALSLRVQGYSYDEIAKNIGTSQATVWLWTRNIHLNVEAENRISWLKKKAVEKSIIASRKKKIMRERYLRNNLTHFIEKIKISRELTCISCALLYWAEGNKRGNGVQFVNSDPQMIRIFLMFLRASFTLDEKKFRVCVHLHEYHRKNEILQFWSEVTRVPLTQFTKPYLKPHTKDVIRNGYKGCIRVSYYDNRILEKIKSMYTYFSDWLLSQETIQY